MRSADTWMDHAWVEAEGLVVDITADQFGHDPIVVVPADDPAYRHAEDITRQLTPTRAAVAAVAAVWPLWCAYADQLQM